MRREAALNDAGAAHPLVLVNRTFTKLTPANHFLQIVKGQRLKIEADIALPSDYKYVC
jgi:hypothetical protein